MKRLHKSTLNVAARSLARLIRSGENTPEAVALRSEEGMTAALVQFAESIEESVLEQIPIVNVTLLCKTSDACPAQWQGRTDDGRQVYIRYRWGYLSVRVAKKDQSPDVWAGVRGEEVFAKQLGGEYDGSLSFEALREATAGTVLVSWPATDDSPLPDVERISGTPHEADDDNHPHDGGTEPA